jgi:hypothetical protein
LDDRKLRRPYGTPDLLWDAANPTLKRGANEHCAYGAALQICAEDEGEGYQYETRTGVFDD